MTDTMPKPLPPYVSRERSRHGKVVFYFRRGKSKRKRLPDLGTEAFEPAYFAALAEAIPPETLATKPHSLAWLIEEYRGTADYQLGLSKATRRQRDNIFKGVAIKSGHQPYKNVTEAILEGSRDDRASTPFQARNFMDAMRGLFRWAKKRRLVSINPALGVENLKRPKTQGFAAWSDEDVAAYETRWPDGTKERVWLHVLLYTGLRRGDAVILGRQHVRNGVATIRTEKSQRRMEVSIPILPMLAETLAIGPTGDLAFIVGATGKPLAKESFGNDFRKACNEAGLRGKSAHGLRKLGATRAAEAGATVAELEALFGWKGGTMASHYTETANRKLLSQSASEKIMNVLRPPHQFDGPHHKKDIV